MRGQARAVVRNLNPILPRSLIALGVGLTLALAVISCGSSDLPTADPSTQAVVSPDSNLELLDPAKGLLGTGLLACRVEPYAMTKKTIGPAGGRIEVGRHVLVVPAGALSAPTLITAEAPSDPVASVRFSPEGLQFNEGRPARLTLDYSNCPLGRLQILKRIAYTTERFNILTYLLSRDNLLLQRVSGDVEHFSRYAVAW
jgi:hypothetical protein